MLLFQAASVLCASLAQSISENDVCSVTRLIKGASQLQMTALGGQFTLKSEHVVAHRFVLTHCSYLAAVVDPLLLLTGCGTSTKVARTIHFGRYIGGLIGSHVF